MLRSYFKIGFRNLNKHRFFSAINIAGMTIGMTCFILIGLYIQYETSYDQQHEKADRIYRVAQYQEGNFVNGKDSWSVTPRPLVPTLKEIFPEVQEGSTVRIQEALFSHGEQVFYEQGLFSDEYFFDVFTYPVLEGIGPAALADPTAIILTESMAKKYFGQESPLGKTLVFEQDHPLTVRGVIADVPKNQHFSFDYITSLNNFRHYEHDAGVWNSNHYRSYIVLPETCDPKELEAKLGVLETYTAAAYQNFPFKPEYFLQALTDIHLHSHINSEAKANGDIRYIYLSVSIAMIILLLASINYMNLATARSGQRAKEVGMRKVLGAQKRQVVSQFMAESTLITLTSFGIAVGLSFLLLPAFNQLLDQQIPFHLGSSPMILIGILGAIFVGILSGLYPALLSSATSPVNAFKGNLFKIRKDGKLLRNALVVGQFTAAIVLATSSVVVFQQVQYIQSKKLGFSREQVVYIPYHNQAIFDKTSTIRSELEQHPQIDQVTYASSMPHNIVHDYLLNDWEGNKERKELSIYRNNVDYDFMDFFEIELLEGRNFSPEYPTDSTSSYILNETAVKALGWTSAVGKKFRGGKVIGVIKDFHFQAFDLAIAPLFLKFHTEGSSHFVGHIAMKVSMDNPESVLSHIQATLNTILPQLPFEHRFLDESYSQLHQTEKRFGKVFNIFTLIALFIACMGLLGLVTQNVMQRTKEIGIRKVLGATIPSIIGLVSKDFIKLVLLSAVLAIPIACLGMGKWLQDFAYRIDLNWWVFVIVGLLAVGLAFLTVSAQAFRAAITNPVDSLKTE